MIPIAGYGENHVYIALRQEKIRKITDRAFRDG